MDKYEYKVSAEEIKSLIAQKEFARAAEIADTIDWRRVRSVRMLCTISDLYKINKRYEDARDVLLLAYDRHPGGRAICYSLCELSIKLDEFVQAVEYYKEFVQVAPKDSGRYILQYKLYAAQGVSLEEQIAVLEELKAKDYREKWAYELAYLYHRVGLSTRCVEECDELVLWFGKGKYVIKALELKMLHEPLSARQQAIYDQRFLSVRQADESAKELSAEPQKLPLDDKEASGEQDMAMEADSSTEEPAEGSGEHTFAEESADMGISREESPEESQEELPENSQEELPSESQEELPEESGEESQEELRGESYGDEDFQREVQVDVSPFSTINLQKALAEGLKEIFKGGESRKAARMQEETDEEDTDHLDTLQMEEVDEEALEPELQREEVLFEETREWKAVSDRNWEEEDYRETGAFGEDAPENAEDGNSEGEDLVWPQDMEAEDVEPEDVGAEDVEPEDTEQENIESEDVVSEDVTFDNVEFEEPEPENVEPEDAGPQDVAPDDAWPEGAEPEAAGPENMEPEEAEEDRAWEELSGEEPGYEATADDEAEIAQQDARILTQATEAMRQGYDLPEELARILTMDSDGQLSFVISRQEQIEKQITGQLNIEDILAELEKCNRQEPESVDVDIQEDEIWQAIREEEEKENAFAESEFEVLENEGSEEPETEEPETEEPEETEDPEIEEPEETGETEEPEIGVGETEEMEFGETEEIVFEVPETDATESGASEAEETDTTELDAEEASAVTEPAEETATNEASGEDLTAKEALDKGEEDRKLGQSGIQSEESERKLAEQQAEQQAVPGSSEDVAVAPRPVERDAAYNRKLTREEKELFFNFVQSRSDRQKLVKVLDGMTLASYTGNVILTGDEGMDVMTLARNMIISVQMSDHNFSGRSAKISGKGLNEKDVEAILDKLQNGALIVERASKMNKDTVERLYKGLQRESRGIIVILVDTRKAMNRFLSLHEKLEECFNLRMDLEALSDERLVSFGKKYAREQEFSIDEMGTLALHSRIQEMQTLDHAVTVMDVKGILDEAIASASRKNIRHFFDILLAKRYDEEDMIILRERDFIGRR